MEILHAFVVIVTTYIYCVYGRAVNISNTWVLPEEGFPVFYRYFRDRISWYEADAVCQFHHGNLVTVDTTSQFDAVRAYLKELDIITNVWIGLSRASDKTAFSWSGERALTGEGFWGEASPTPGVAVCAAADPVADFRWHALTCGGPEVASFICELPVPPWATGANGCMLTSLPSLTVIYLPEQTAVELTSDCGLDGTKRIACKGKADQQEMMRQLSCGITHDDFDDKAVSKAPSLSTTFDSSASNSMSNEIISSSSSKVTSQKAATKPWIWTSNTIDTSDYGSPTRHRRETEDTFSTAGGISLSTTDITSHNKHNMMDTTETSSIKPYYPTTRSNFEASTPVKMTSNANQATISVANDKSAITTVSTLLETNRQRPSSKSLEPVTTLRPTRTSNAPDVTTTESSTEDTPNGDYPSINQGQLFSIIVNGTMFDIIEMNDTSETYSDMKIEKTTISTLKSSHGTLIDTLLTTKLSNPTVKPLFTTTTFSTTVGMSGDYNKMKNSVQDSKLAVSSDKTSSNSKHFKTPNDLIDGQDEKTFMKAIEAFPSDTSSLVKLNRTNRKELPLVDFSINSTEDFSIVKQNTTDFKEIDKDFTITPQETVINKQVNTENHEHKIVEITITDIERKTDATKFYVTTKKYDKSRGSKKTDKTKEKLIADNSKAINTFPENKNDADNNIKNNFTADININIEISEMPIENITDTNITMDEKVEITIDSKLNNLNNNTKNININSENITGILLTKNNSDKNIKQVTPTDDIGEYEEDNAEPKEDKTTEEPLEPIPEIQPRPNRNRVLTRPQRRSFYPYFFSRVLG